MLRQVIVKLQQFSQIRMALACSSEVQKRPADIEEIESNNKKQKVELLSQLQVRTDVKRKVALLIAYNGKGYFGLQINPGMKTIEGEICKALLDVGLIPQEHYDDMHKMSFQRAARTDKGVSAAGNVLSLKMLLNVENLLDKVNEKLSPQIRVMDYVRTTKGFNSKNLCDGRTYLYLLPTYALAPIEEVVTHEYRVNLDIIEKANEILNMYVGTHNFHNFTSGIKPTEPRAKRVIREFECRLPFVQDGVEFCILAVTGQSFMLHQIRKMVGLMIAIIKGLCGIDAIERAWQHEKMDVPKAPGLGLVLEKLHYHHYNSVFGNDGIHKKIEWSHITEKLDKFKEEQIFSEIIKEEIETQSMMSYLAHLPVHTCGNDMSWQKRRALTRNTQGVEIADNSDVEKGMDMIKLQEFAGSAQTDVNNSNVESNVKVDLNKSTVTNNDNKSSLCTRESEQLFDTNHDHGNENQSIETVKS